MQHASTSKSSDGAIVTVRYISFHFIHISEMVKVKGWKILPHLAQQHIKQQSNALLCSRGMNHNVGIKFFQSVHSKATVHQVGQRSFVLEELPTAARSSFCVTAIHIFIYSDANFFLNLNK